jgi:uncharacterized membrane protein YfcA
LYEWFLPLLGFLIAVFAAMTGIGGGVLFVPLLMLSLGISPSVAVGTSLFAMIFGGLGATIGYSRQKRVYFKAALLLALATAPGAILGAYMTSILSSTILGLVFAAFLMILAARMITTSKFFQRNSVKIAAHTVACETECFRDKKRLSAAFVLSLFAGVVSGLLGIGGGVVLVPILLMVVYLPMHVAVGTSMFLVMLTSISGVVQHSYMGNVDFVAAALLAAGAFVGAQFGAWLSKKVSADWVQVLFAAALVIVGSQMLLKYLSIV